MNTNKWLGKRVRARNIPTAVGTIVHWFSPFEGTSCEEDMVAVFFDQPKGRAAETVLTSAPQMMTLNELEWDPTPEMNDHGGITRT